MYNGMKSVSTFIFIIGSLFAPQIFAANKPNFEEALKTRELPYPKSERHTIMRNGQKITMLNKKPRHHCTISLHNSNWSTHDSTLASLTYYDSTLQGHSGVIFHRMEHSYDPTYGFPDFVAMFYTTYWDPDVGTTTYGPPGAVGIYICLPDEFNPPVQPPNPNQCPNTVQGSVIDVNTQTLGEMIPIVGTPFELTYVSDRDPARVVERQISIPLKQYWTDPAATSLHLDITYDGQTDTMDFSVPDLAKFDYTYTWDGKNRSGAYVPSMKIKFFVWQTPTGSERPDDATSYATLSRFDAGVIGLGGWMITPHHFFDKALNRLYRGDGRTFTAQYTNISGGNIRVVDESGEIYIFDGSGNHLETRTSLLNSIVYSFSYDGSGRLQSITDAYSNVTTINRDMSGVLTGITSPFSQTTTLALNGLGRLVTVTNPKSEVYKLTYHQSGAGLLKSFRKPQGQISNFSYNDIGRLTKDERVGGPSTTISYSGSPTNGEVTFTSKGGIEELYSLLNKGVPLNPVIKSENTDAGGVQRTYREEAMSIASTNGDTGMYKAFSYDPRFSTLKFTSQDSINDGVQAYNHYYSRTSNHAGGDPFSYTTLTNTHSFNGNDETSVFDQSTKTWTNTSFEGRVSTVVLDTKERVVETDDAASSPMTFTYNSLGQMTAQTQGSRTTTYSYASSGFLASTTNALSEQTQHTYDLAGNLTKTTLPDSREINYTYDANGKVLSIQPPGRSAYRYSYGAASEILNSLLPPELFGDSDWGIFSFFDDDNRLTKIKRPDGSVLTYSYISGKNLKSSISDGTDAYTFGGYDINGLPGHITGPDGFKNQWIRRGQLVLQDQLRNSSNQVIARVGFDYENFRLIELKIEDSSTSQVASVEYEYDKDYLLESAGVLDYTRSSSTGYVTAATLDNLSETYSYNSTYGEQSGFSLSYSSTVKYAYTVTRDLLGRIDSMTENILGTSTTYTYIYDSAGRLSEVKVGGVTVSENTYDSNSNRTSGQVQTQSFSATYDGHDRLTEWNNYDYSYNKNGERASKTNTSTSAVTTYGWDAWGKLKRVTLPSADIIRYRYDGLGRKLQVRVNSNVESIYLYQDDLKLSAVLNSSGMLVSHFVWGEKRNVPEYMVKSGVSYRLVSDTRGSVRLVLNASTGAVAQQLDYDEWGKVTNDTNPGFQPFGFAGGLYDYHTGLVQFGARHYDAETGRWLSKDPILFEGGDTNLYGYTFQDPINFVDVTGLDACIRTEVYHFSVSIDDPSGGVRVFDFYPKPGTGVMTPWGTYDGKVDDKHYPSKNDAPGIDVMCKKQSKQDDEFAIAYAKLLQKRVANGKNKFNPFNFGPSGSQNCWGFAVQVYK